MMSEYAAAGTYLAIGALTSAIAVLPMFYQNAFLACGNSRVHFITMSAFAVLRIGGLITGFYIAGVEGMLIGVGVGTLAGLILVANFARKAGWLSLRIDLVSVGVVLVGGYLSFAWHEWIGLSLSF